MGKAVIAIHGGAGAISRAQMSLQQELRYIEALSAIVETGQKMLEAGESALDVVTEAVRLLEECPLFNAGIGAVFTRDETHELDACVMDGNTLKAGAVAGVSHLRNPVLAARLVMEQSPHVMMIGEGAENFAFARGMERVSPEIFSTSLRYEQLLAARKEGATVLDHSGAPLDEKQKMGTAMVEDGCPLRTSAVKRTPLSICSVCSCITTASQPSGTGAPVIIRMQVPAGHSPWYG